MLVSIPAFLFVSELILTLIPINTRFENRFFLVNRALDYLEVFKKDKNLFWRFRPSQTVSSRFFENKTYHINSLGLRGDEIDLQTDKIRIAALGNSCTFGWGIDDSGIYINQLKKLIDSDSDLPQVEVINAGIPGYSSWQGRRLFQSDILPLKPRVVLIMFAWNDQWAAADNIPDCEQKMPPQFIIDLQNLFSRLKIYRLIKKLALSAVEQPLRTKLIKENPVYRVSETDLNNNLTAIIQACRIKGLTPILLTSPIPSLTGYYPPGSRSLMHTYHECYIRQTRLVASSTETFMVDLAAEFDKYDDLFDDAAYDPIHFNARGHRVAAETIYGFIKKNPQILNRGVN